MDIQKYIKDRFLRMTNDKYVCEELTQITNIIILERKYKLEDKPKAIRLLNLITRSVYIDYLRSKKSKKEIELTEDIISTYSAENYLISKENEEIIINKLSRLTDDQSDVLLLRTFFKMNYKDISKIMKCSFNTALSHFHYAKNKIKD